MGRGAKKVAVEEIVRHRLSKELENPLTEEEVIDVAKEQERFKIHKVDGKVRISVIPTESGNTTNGIQNPTPTQN